MDEWNVKPHINNTKEAERYFYNSADWLYKNADYQSGLPHFIYKFNWPYKGYPSGGLEAPWWSGLTDGYAIILLLRAYDYFKEEKFLVLAGDLYKSVLTKVEDGGSLSFIKGQPWIEEYIDPRFKSENMAYVFNGMVYATYGIEAYENFSKISNRKSESLYRAIFNMLPFFDRNGWSDYDLLGNSNNIKYHKIHVALLGDLLKRKNGKIKEDAASIAMRWRWTAQNPGVYYLLYGPRGVAYYHFVVLLFAVINIPALLYVIISYRSKRNDEIMADYSNRG
uniref:D-glucuronyl C5-epimerase family protein n=1 Tax=Castellaniella defragrans TaxID=75697 RepID=UPI00334035A7